MIIYCIISTAFMVLCSAKAIGSSEPLCHQNDIEKNRVPFCLTTSRNSEEFGKSSFNCLDICLLLFSYFSSFLYSAIKKYAGDEAAEIIFISSFNLKQRGIRQ